MDEFEMTWALPDGTEEELTFLYEVEPYSPGGRDEPPSGGYAIINEVRRADGSVVENWESIGLDKKAIERIEEKIYEDVGDRERAARESWEEDAYDRARDRELDGE